MTVAGIEQLTGLETAALPAVAAPARPELPGLRKAAVFLAQMSKEEAGVLLAKMRPREVESLTRELKGSDEICSKLEVLEILPPEQMAELLKKELAERGFTEQEDGTMTRTNGKSTVTIEPFHPPRDRHGTRKSRPGRRTWLNQHRLTGAALAISCTRR